MDTPLSLQSLFSSLRAEIKEINGLAVVSSDGRVIASDWHSGGVDVGKIGAIASALLGLGKKSVEILSEGEFQQVVLQSSSNVVSVYSAGAFAMLIASMSNTGNLGMLNILAKRKAAEISTLINPAS
jgi:predicted regulator of Ras-like GTPase activity (Roadblock/LC7/MglB family)